MQIRDRTISRRWKSTDAAAPGPAPPRKPAVEVPGQGPAAAHGKGKKVDLTQFYTSISRNEKHRKSQERDFLVSVLSSSPTKRDTKKYLQTFGTDKGTKAVSAPKGIPPLEVQLREQIEQQHLQLQLDTPPAGSTSGALYAADSIQAVGRSPKFVQEPAAETAKQPADGQPHVAIVKLQAPDTIDDATLAELAKTFAQLRALGLLSVIVIGRTLPASADASKKQLEHGWFDYVTHEVLRVADAIDKYDDPVTSLVDAAVCIDERDGAYKSDQHARLDGSRFVPGRVYIDRDESLLRPLRKGDIVIIPPYAFSKTSCEAKLVDSDDIVLALTRYFAGLQLRQPQDTTPSAEEDEGSIGNGALASVDRVIVLDPIGGTPSPRRPNGAHVFLNMEEEYASANKMLDAMAANGLLKPNGDGTVQEIKDRHKANLDVLRNTLALLPSTSSALLTTPAEAASLVLPAPTSGEGIDDIFGYVGSVGTRRSQNPLIHNLLTDRPVYSSSLPIGRIAPLAKRSKAQDQEDPQLSKTTLLKRGMPLTIYPDPRITPWTPPVPGAPRLRLTDTCIDLPRLVHLIEDSFNRKLDVDDYLRRVEKSLAGVIIAGEYEGGAILTWERPFGLDEETAYRTGRLVPYLDKFAVLKKSQGAGGVADIVFTAMVRDCFPDGVCWRSRKDNPVNRWYFERSRGSWKLGGVNWTMFWTTPWEAVGEKGIWDYESVCRGVEPSWADQKHVLD